MKIGLFGGTFDPIHVGHLIIAETVRSDFSLDRLLFVPAAVPPHKKYRDISSGSIRLEMVRSAISGHPYFEVSDAEIRRGGISYTVETVRRFQESEEWAGNAFYLLIGADSFRDLKNWKKPKEILDRIRVLVVERPSFGIEEIEAGFDEGVTLVRAPLVGISSNEIRRRVREGKSIRYWVPESVEQIIRREGLYL